MGTTTSRLPQDKLDQYSKLTFLRPAVIQRCFDRFRDMNEDRIDANIDEERVPNDIIVQEFPELVSNPFGPQLCRVFSSANDKATMNFEDFLDMCSVLSPNAPIQTKADWAFRVFDDNNDGLITAPDIENVVLQLCGTNTFSAEDLEQLVQHVLNEAEGRESDAIGPQEFRNIISRAPDFALNFTIRF